jgi:hypothetical protein
LKNRQFGLPEPPAVGRTACAFNQQLRVRKLSAQDEQPAVAMPAVCSVSTAWLLLGYLVPQGICGCSEAAVRQFGCPFLLAMSSLIVLQSPDAAGLSGAMASRVSALDFAMPRI